MEISIQITKDVAYALASNEAELSRVAIEALAIEGYRQNRLSEHQIAQMLQLGGRMDVHAFLKARKVPLNYSVADLEADAKALAQFEAALPA